MGYTLKATLDCNGECRSCYETAIREKGKTPYDFAAILETLNQIIHAEAEKEDEGKGYRKCHVPTFHGGEPLLMDFQHLEFLAHKIHGFWDYCGIQTNGLLITDKHLDLFQQYKFNLGISLDGDTAELNFGRWNRKERSAAFIQEKTDLVIENMRKAYERKIPISMIVVLRKYNASPDRIYKLIKFLRRMWKEFQIVHIRTNIGVVYNPEFRTEEELTGKEFGFALETIHDYMLTNPALRYRPFIDIADLMLGNYDQTCTFGECDAFHTTAEMAINHNGIITNCLHPAAAVEGFQVPQADAKAFERYHVLFNLPQEHGGCKDCEYWHICHGACPGAGIGNDWRSRSRFCEGYKMIFKKFEKLYKSLMPNLFLPPDLYPLKPTAEEVQFALRMKGASAHRKDNLIPIDRLKKRIAERQEKAQCRHADMHTDRHGDKPHGDHTDYARLKK